MSFVKHVWADFGAGKVLAHVVGQPVTVAGENGPEIKTPIQAPDGSVHNLAHREPDDRDGHGSGLTFWTAGI